MKHHHDLGSSAIPLKIEVGQVTHPGMLRSSNEDSVLMLQFRPEGASSGICFGLYAIADGVGGHHGGEIASDLAVRVLAKSLEKSPVLPNSGAAQSDLDKQQISWALSEAMKSANKEVYKRGKSEATDMGTTMTAALIIDATAYIANVGDSRAYLLQGKQLRQITTDHSIVVTLLAAGLITAQEIYTHPRRNIITRSLGIREHVEVDLFE